MRDSDELYYLVADPVTEGELLTIRPDAINLYDTYAHHSTNRRRAYERVADIVIDRATLGRSVVYSTYGDPMFGSISSSILHRACLESNIPFRSLPGISSLTALASDLGIDWITAGITGLDAKQLCETPVATLGNAPTNVCVIWQPATVNTYSLTAAPNAPVTLALRSRINKMLGDTARLFRYRADLTLSEFTLDYIPDSRDANIHLGNLDTIVAVKASFLQRLPILARSHSRHHGE